MRSLSLVIDRLLLLGEIDSHELSITSMSLISYYYISDQMLRHMEIPISVRSWDLFLESETQKK